MDFPQFKKENVLFPFCFMISLQVSYPVNPVIADSLIVWQKEANISCHINKKHINNSKAPLILLSCTPAIC